jgi:hypothetical protein
MQLVNELRAAGETQLSLNLRELHDFDTKHHSQEISTLRRRLFAIAPSFQTLLKSPRNLSGQLLHAGKPAPCLTNAGKMQGLESSRH